MFINRNASFWIIERLSKLLFKTLYECVKMSEYNLKKICHLLSLFLLFNVNKVINVAEFLLLGKALECLNEGVWFTT